MVCWKNIIIHKKNKKIGGAYKLTENNNRNYPTCKYIYIRKENPEHMSRWGRGRERETRQHSTKKLSMENSK